MPTTTVTTSSPTPTLSAVLQLLLPLIHTLPLSLDTLNKSHFVPESKDEDLHAGVLQLPQGTVLLVTEGAVTEGQLLERGTLHTSSQLSIPANSLSCRGDERARPTGRDGRPDATIRLPVQPVLVPY